MKYIYSFMLLFFCGSVINAQNFAAVDQRVRTYPATIANTGEITSLILKDFASPQERARAAFYWIASNIAYDTDGAGKMNNESVIAFKYANEKDRIQKELKFKKEVLLKILKTKSGVCHDYCILFEDFCTKLGIESKIVPGNLKSDYTQINNKELVSNHSWNVVKLNNEWKTVDVTLAAGYLLGSQFVFDYNDKYFLPASDQFFLNHFPDDKKWLSPELTKDRFVKLPLFYGEYLRKEIAITSPSSGEIKIGANDILVLEFDKDLSEDDTVLYHFHTDKKSYFAYKQESGSGYEIPFKVKQNDYLSIFINKKIVATYKVIL